MNRMMDIRKATVSALAVIGSVVSAFANVVVDDTPVTADVTVPAGEELEIRGSGLGAATGISVSLGDGAKVKFYTTATIAAPITASGAVTLQGDPGVVGTLTGGATFNGNVVMETGEICFAAGTVNNYAHLTVKGGHLTIRNCSWYVQGASHYTQLNSSAQVEDACLEIAEGGRYEIKSLANNCYCYVGSKPYESKVLVNGGVFVTGYDAFYLNKDSGTGTAVIEIKNGGTFKTYRAGFNVGGGASGSSTVILGENSLFQCAWGNWSHASLARDSGTLTYSIEGRATLDISGYPAAMSDAYSATSGNKVRWTCTENGFLTIKGRTDGTTNLSLRNVDSGLKFDFAPNAGTLTLVNPADSMALTMGYSPSHATRVVSLNENCALTLDAVLAGGTAVQYSIDDVLTARTEGFSSVTVGNVAVDAPNAFAYLSGRCMAALSGTVSLVSGTLLLDTNPGEKLEQGAGTMVYLQDTENAYVMRNESKYAAVSEAGWRDPENVLRSWQSGAIAAIETKDSNGSLSGVHIAHGLNVGGSGSHYWDGSAGRFEVGPGGIEFTQSKMWGLASGNCIPRIVLTDNQTWTNAAASGTAYMQLGFSYNKPKYYNAYVKAAAGVTDWRIAGKLETWLYSPSNDLHDVTVTVTSPARLCLIGNIDARLNAQELVLDGADMAFAAAGRSDTNGSTGPTVTAIDAFHLAPTVTLKDGGTLTAGAAKTPFAVPTLRAIGDGNRLKGTSVVITQDVTSVILPTAADRLVIESEIVNAEPSFDVTGAGTLALAATLAADVVFRDGGTLELTGEGTYAGSLQGAGNLIVNASGTVALPDGALANYAGETLTVSSGALAFANAAAIPAGVTIVTTGDGALILGDPTGFDPAARMGGTKNLVASGGLIVTEVPRENEQLTVGAGETLQVFGSGLKGSSSVTLEDGAGVIFFYTATVAAPITATGAATLTACAGAVGKLTGAYVADTAGTATKRTDVKGDGLIDFANGVTFKNEYGMFRGNGGHALVSAGTMTLRSTLHMLAGDLTFTNSTLSFVGGNSLNLANTTQTGDVKVEFLAGSKWNLGNNQSPIIGYSNEFESRIVLNGGEWSCTTSDAFTLCGSGRGIGIFELKAGRFYSNRRITAGNGGTSKFIWSGGTFSGQWNSTDYKYDHLINGPISEFLIAGDCTLALYRMTSSVVSNFNNSAATMRALPGSSLTVVSEDTTAGWCTNVVFTNFKGDGMKLVMKKSKVNGYPTVEFADATEPIALTRELPANTGDEGGLVKAVGMTDSMLVNYEIPSGFTYDPSADYGYWYEGFSSVAVSNLIFKAGSSYRFPIVDSVVTPYSILGSLVLPETMTYLVDVDARPSKIVGVTVIEPALGIEGECTWTCGGGLSKRDSRVYAENGVLKLDYEPKGALLIVR